MEIAKGYEELYTQAKNFWNKFKSGMINLPTKHLNLHNLKLATHVTKIRDFKMPKRLAPNFITKYAGLYEVEAKSHLDVYTLKLPIRFITHSTFHVSKLKLFL